ncbi:MAG: protein kinase, partial [Kofleriaceae bacterium]
KYGYMSPEQCKGKPIDRRSDIFALGIVLYEITTLRRAFKGNDDFETMKRIVGGDVVLPSIAVPGYPRELEAIVLTAMAGDPNARFQNGAELIEALDAFATRAKLTGSNTAMGRFMTQLFGSKREPWTDGGNGNADPTEISDDDDNAQTVLHEGRMDFDLDPPAPPVPVVDAAAWHGVDQRRPRLAAGSAEPFVDYGTAMPVPTIAGPAPVPRPVRHTPPAAQQIMQADDLSDAGASPLVDDPNLGWSTSVGNASMAPTRGGYTRLSSEVAASEYKIPSNNRWLAVAILLLVVVAGAVVAIMFLT